MIRPAKPFDIPLEDILPQMPSKHRRFVEIDPPNWALGALMFNTGEHGPTYPKPSALHNYPGYRPLNPEFPYGKGPGVESMQSFWDKTKGKISKQKLNNQFSARKMVTEGNLGNDDYRFWRGMADKYKTLSECRWCQQYKWNREERIEHFRNGNECNMRLLALYKFATKMWDRGNWHCFACDKHTAHKIWGVPLCDTPGCLLRWKFAPMATLDGYNRMKDMSKIANPSPYEAFGPEVADKS